MAVAAALMAATAGPAASPGLAAPVALNANLISNPDAELGRAAPDMTLAPAPPGWIRSGRFTSIHYGAGPGLPDAETIVAPALRGRSFFVGGPNNGGASGVQTVDVSALAAQIDTGTLTYVLSGYLGGGPHSRSTALTADFLDASGARLRRVTLGPVTAADRAPGVVALLHRDTQGPVPAGTRTVVVKVAMAGTAGTYNDGGADNLFLMFTDRKPGAMIPAGSPAPPTPTPGSTSP